jgi:hypothetical protein
MGTPLLVVRHLKEGNAALRGRMLSACWMADVKRWHMTPLPP